jgi:hypothetical protein
MNWPIIGIHGRKQAGKDTLARFIIAARGGYQCSFADPIRRMLKAGLNIDMDDPYWIARKEEPIPLLGKSPRQLMQTLGTEWGRDLVHPNLWVFMAAQVYIASGGPGMVIPDVRLQEEFNWIHENDGLIIFLERKDALPPGQHRSDFLRAPKPGDLVIQNNGTLEELQAEVNYLFGPQA